MNTDAAAVAIIGTGTWGARLAAAVLRTPSLYLAACYSRSEEKRSEFAGAFGCEASPSFEAVLQHPAVQGVILVTPNHTHAAQTKAAAAHGKHVFVEKPIADSLQDGRDMDAACRDHGVTLMVGHAFRRLGAARKVKELIDQGTLGRIVLVESNFSLPASLTPQSWRYYRETCPGGPLMQLGIHHADTLQYWLGKPQEVMGSFARLVTPAEIDDLGTVQITYEDGSKAVISSSYVSPKTYYLRAYGTLANVIYNADMSVWPQAQKMDGATTLTLQTREGSEQIPFDTRDMLVEELDEFARCISGEASPETNGELALDALKVIRGAILSDQQGRSVLLAEL